MIVVFWESECISLVTYAGFPSYSYRQHVRPRATETGFSKTEQVTDCKLILARHSEKLLHISCELTVADFCTNHRSFVSMIDYEQPLFFLSSYFPRAGVGDIFSAAPRTRKEK